MQIEKYKIEEFNHSLLAAHQRRFQNIAAETSRVEEVISKLVDFQIAIPSWALGTGGTRFGRFSGEESRETWRKKSKTSVCFMP
jgi:L-rhamnose isomerase/sugar isomerase